MVHDLGARGVDEERAGPQAVEDAQRRRGSVSPVSARDARSATSLSAATASGDGSTVMSDAAWQLRGLRRARHARTAGSIPHLHPECRGAQGHLLADAAKAEQTKRPSVAARAPSRTPSCSSGPRADRRRCRRCGGRAPGSGRRRARRPQCRCGPGNSIHKCRGVEAAATSIVFTPAPALTISDSARRRASVR